MSTTAQSTVPLSSLTAATEDLAASPYHDEDDNNDEDEDDDVGNSQIEGGIDSTDGDDKGSRGFNCHIGGQGR